MVLKYPVLDDHTNYVQRLAANTFTLKVEAKAVYIIYNKLWTHL